MIGVHLRWMIQRDVPSVMQIEEDCFEFPWTEGVLFQQLRQPNCIGMVAELGEVVCGFMIYEIHPSHIHVINFCVGKDYQRQHIGQMMVEKLIGKLSEGRRSRLYCEIRETNINALDFFKAQGFRSSRIRRGVYVETNEDAIEMVYRLHIGANELLEERMRK